MRAYERLLKYAQVFTTSDEESDTTPSTSRQFDLAGMLVEEMKEIGISGASVDDKCYVYGHLPATEGMEDVPAIGLIAHLDTAPDFCGAGVHPLIHENYDGGPVALGNSGRVLSPEMFPRLKERVGQTLITTDGTTLLGADDKAGIAEILTAAETLIREDIPHGKVCIAFTPDEEIGSGAKDLDLERFGADFAYTLDGGVETEVVFETFNAAAARFDINGFNIHPGEAKDKMINAAQVAVQIVNALPSYDTPRDTENYEGFYHLTAISGDVEHAYVSFIVRDHSPQMFETRKVTLHHIEKRMNEIWGEGTVTLKIKEQYRNMAEKIVENMHIVETAREAVRSLGREPDGSPVRGGTDGASLTFRGLCCPNLGTGGDAFHGPYEHITAEAMDFCVQVVIRILESYAKG